MKHKNTNKKFIEKYEKELKEYREKYYRNIINISNQDKEYPAAIFYTIPIIIVLIILLISKFTIIGYAISFISIFISNYIIKYISKKMQLEPFNEYLEAIKRNGYNSIEEYEKKVRDIITGPNGYYQEVLKNLINLYKIDNTTRTVSSAKGEEYYYWINRNRDKIMLLNTKTNQKPEVKTIQIGNVRYFRIDNEKKELIINTSTEIYHFKTNSFDIFNEVLKEKRLENLTTFTPGTYIDDFEIYIHSIKSEDNKLKQKNEDKFTNYVNSIAVLSICLGVTAGLLIILDKYHFIINLIALIIIMIINTKLRRALSIEKSTIKTDADYIKELNNNSECIERFNELKFVLGIKPTYDKIYTTEGAEYITWLSNGYFHVFLNLIYFNSVYMVVKLNDVKYYKLEKNECTVKLKDKTLVFTKDAEAVFRKILPNKDYYWLKGYQK
jgi:vacuolar-type H+-ATPase subunit E/Vma4